MVMNIDLDDVGNLVASVKASIAAAEHLEPTDEGAIKMALIFAEEIEAALESDEPKRREKVMFGPIGSLSKILNDLGLTPAGRANLGLDVEGEPPAEEF